MRKDGALQRIIIRGHPAGRDSSERRATVYKLPTGGIWNTLDTQTFRAPGIQDTSRACGTTATRRAKAPWTESKTCARRKTAASTRCATILRESTSARTMGCFAHWEEKSPIPTTECISPYRRCTSEPRTQAIKTCATLAAHNKTLTSSAASQRQLSD